jgi:hypothetical protein
VLLGQLEKSLRSLNEETSTVPKLLAFVVTLAWVKVGGAAKEEDASKTQTRIVNSKRQDEGKSRLSLKEVVN